MTKSELAKHFEYSKLPADTHYMNRFLGRAELEGIICGGEVKGKQHTYTLLEEHVPPTPELTKDESLARLARSYFRSHAPATLQDFIWWSGLLATEAKQAIYLIEPELTAGQWNGQTWYVHETCRTRGRASNSLCLLPPWDEYLISYKDRTDVLPMEYYSKAFTNNGLFFPVIAYKGHIVGNWSKATKKGRLQLECTYFQEQTCMDENLLEQAKLKYTKFLE